MAVEHFMQSPMSTNDQTGTGLKDEIHKLSENGRSWLASEVALAKAEVASDGKNLLRIVALIFVAIGFGIAALMLLSLAFVAWLAPYVGGLSNASAIVALLFVAIATISSWTSYKLSKSCLGWLNVFNRWSAMAKQGLGSTP
jgi:uncharacterized membrane protein YqjE